MKFLNKELVNKTESTLQAQYLIISLKKYNTCMSKRRNKCINE